MLSLVTLAACDPGDPSTDGTTPSGVACVPQPDNVLRVDCTIDATSATTLRYTDPDGVAVEVDAEGGATTLWGLRPATTYAVEVAGASTRFTTGALPEPLAGLTVEVTGASSLEAVVQEVSCDGASYAVVLDTTGVVRWYQLVSRGGDVMGLSVTDTPSVLALTGEGIREWSFTGEPGLTVDVGPGDLRLHHDVIRAGDDTLALFLEEVAGPDGGVYLVDGVAVFDPGGALVDRWHLADHVDPSWLAAGGGPPPGAGPSPPPGEPVDWSHANGITLTADGDWIVSFRWLSAVYAIDGHRGEPSFGEVLAVLTGDPASPIPSSFAVDAGGGFVGQHHATLVGDELTLFDNRAPPETSRALTLRIDEEAGTAGVIEAHSVGEECPVEGGAFPLPDGGVFATCATSGTGLEFPAGSGDHPSFTIRATCASSGGPGGAPPVGRIVPIPLP